tara:strand:- start:3465 stop:3614 length:150 start_codon:yes stop_codon:yes gene_type:complete
MKTLNLAIVCLSCLLSNPVLSHGGANDCSEECESMYCPTEDSKKEKKNS